MKKFLLTKEDNDQALDSAYNGLVGFLDDKMSGERKKRLAPPPPAEEVPDEETELQDDTPSEAELEEALAALGE